MLSGKYTHQTVFATHLTSLHYRQANVYADGTIIESVDEFEPETIAAAREWYEGILGKKIILVGPQLPDYFFADEPTTALKKSSTSTKISDVIEFMNKAHRTHGPKSVLYISFGTLFYPFLFPSHINTLINTLLETGTPFVFSRAPMTYAPIPSELENKTQESGLGLLVDWVPQQELLAHPALMAFLTHGGANSMFESLTLGVVNVIWPFMADQPQHAAFLEQKVSLYTLFYMILRVSIFHYHLCSWILLLS